MRTILLIALLGVGCGGVADDARDAVPLEADAEAGQADAGSVDAWRPLDSGHDAGSVDAGHDASVADAAAEADTLDAGADVDAADAADAAPTLNPACTYVSWYSVVYCEHTAANPHAYACAGTVRPFGNTDGCLFSDTPETPPPAGYDFWFCCP